MAAARWNVSGKIEGNILDNLDDEPFSCDFFSRALSTTGEEVTVTAFEVVAETERRWTQSHSALLRLTLAGCEKLVFLKKINARHLPPKTFADLHWTLKTYQNEARFYREFMPILAANGVALLRTVLIDERLDALDAVWSSEEEQEKIDMLCSGGLLLILDAAEGYVQASPFATEQSLCALRSLAKMHAVAWENSELLCAAADRLHPVAGYWALCNRPEKEIQQMESIWQQYVKAFDAVAPDLFARSSIQNLAKRLLAMAPWVTEQLAASPGDQFATLVHGDAKAMNIFLPTSDSPGRSEALLIDFQFTGLGFGMEDVAIQICHSVAPDALQESGEEQLVYAYRNALLEVLGGDVAAAYTADIAMRHYRLGVLDYARHVFSFFFKDASPATFVARAALHEAPNIGLAYKSVDASLQFVQRVDRYLEHFEHQWSSPPDL